MTDQQHPGAGHDGRAPKHLLHVFATFAVGGAQVRVCDLINHFGAKYKHTIVALDGDHACRRKLGPGADVRHVSLDYDKRQPLRTLGVFRRALNEIRPDLLLTYNWGAVEWGLVNLAARVCPHVHAEDGFGPDEAAGQKARRVWARRVALARAYRVVVPSRTLEKIARGVWRFPASRVIYIPNGVNLERYAPRAAQPDLPQLAALRPGLVVGTVATLRREKNIPRLMRVFTRATGNAPRTRLVIVGDGPEHAGLARQVAAERLSGRVHLLGHLDDPAAAIRAFDVFAISSDTEQMPISILEAMAAGLPVVGTDVGDIREMVAPANRAYLAPPADEARFEQNLTALLSDAALRDALGRANRERCAALFDKEAMFAAYGKLYDLAL
jgi:glycosyltransferase involved in cell wall biosynthesis